MRVSFPCCPAIREQTQPRNTCFLGSACTEQRLLADLPPRPRKDKVHGDSRKACHHPPALCPRVQGTITQALYGTVGPTVVEVPGSCAFLVKHWPGQAKNSLSWDQCVSGK